MQTVISQEYFVEQAEKAIAKQGQIMADIDADFSTVLLVGFVLADAMEDLRKSIFKEGKNDGKQ